MIFAERCVGGFQREVRGLQAAPHMEHVIDDRGRFGPHPGDIEGVPAGMKQAA